MISKLRTTLTGWISAAAIERALVILLVIAVVIGVLVLSRGQTLNVYCNIAGYGGE